MKIKVLVAVFLIGILFFGIGYEGYSYGYELGLVSGEKLGYDKGHEEGYKAALTDKVFLRNITYEELKIFLERDQTNFHIWIPGNYTCGDFAADLNNNAEAERIRAAVAWLIYGYPQGGKWGHFINVFETNDKGLVFIEPQTDELFDLKVGDTYQGQLIKEIIIIW